MAMACYGTLATTYGSMAFPHKSVAVAERVALARRLDKMNAGHPLYLVIAFFAKLAKGSYPLAILLLSLVVRIALAPLTFRQIKKSKKMQDLQPKMAELQKRHSSDIAALSASIRKLQDENGIHPYLGAAIGLVQGLIFLAIYNAVTLYQYHVIGSSFLWIGTPFAVRHPGLLAPTLCDPDLGLACLYALTMFATQRIIARFSAPVAVDAATSKAVSPMLSLMGPIMAFVMVYVMRSPAAFVLYWMISTLIACVIECLARRRLVGKVEA